MKKIILIYPRCYSINKYKTKEQMKIFLNNLDNLKIIKN